MAECGGAEYLLAAELMCPVCLSTYQDPESLRCGHSFCRDCIHKALTSQRDQDRAYSCPMCQAEYEEFPELQRNFHLCSIVQTVSDLHKKGSGDSSVLCSYCLGDSFPAVKTCLNCEVSLCLQHLERHNNKSHVLVEPTESIEDRKCPEHDRLLEYYCENDQSCICVTCYIAGSHKGHSIMTLKEAHEKQPSTLSQIVSSLQDSEGDISKDLEELHKGLEKLKENTNHLSKPLKDLSQEILSQVKHQWEEIINSIISNEEAKTLEITSITKQMELKRAEALQTIQDLETVRGQGDDLLFIRGFRRSQEQFKQQDFKMNTLQVLDVETDPSMIADIQEETARYIAKINYILKLVHRNISVQTQQLVWSGGSRQPVQPEPFIYKKLVKACKLDLGFNYQPSPNIPGVRVSNGNKTATFQSNPQPVYDSYTRVSRVTPYSDLYIPSTIGSIKAAHGSSGRVFWLVNVCQAKKWCVGVTSAINTAANWYLKWDGSYLTYGAGNAITLLSTPIEVVKVELDFDDNVIGFYSTRAGSEEEKLLLICRCEEAFKQDLCPGFGIMSGSLILL
ncbi:E3 ubiquitin/ISG15 ligase TRIM25-like [Ascaphus truei]|uniref:E3 ubiquitin/ISG15 ligase TRIM25-like n=1 Tax=Ascaphus truei TaxID=8439 RepID=UPI003F5A3A0F